MKPTSGSSDVSFAERIADPDLIKERPDRSDQNESAKGTNRESGMMNPRSAFVPFNNSFLLVRNRAESIESVRDESTWNLIRESELDSLTIPRIMNYDSDSESIYNFRENYYNI
ncbi:hypothetical protein AVEN_50441-1 [Araneus ventricosus]|uniref:Uncharacterized protein n=1 Tax=Araneus ventricosus TaxID=182803 RepID=A0A4Y2RU25_ARAVE|nr:hypothetical protein AVEN_50441-1 [Araneus ventricosus]